MMEDEPAAARANGSAARLGPNEVDKGLGISRPAARGRRKPGRRPKLSEGQQAEIVDEVCSGRRTAAEMARHFRVSEPTISRVLAPHRARAGVCAAAGQGGIPLSAERVVGVLPASALGGRIAIVGTSGSGKTYAAKGLVEHLLSRGARVCVVDPLGVWWGLRVSVESSAPAPHPVVVFGGAHADVPLDPGMGTALGRLVGTQPIACVVDVSDLGSAAARRAFMTAFTEAIYEANTDPLHLVLDEADLWAPQRAQPDGQDLLGWIEEIVRRGRVRGFVPWLITQRPAVLHKDVLSQADILVSMKLTSSQDRAAVGRWLEGQADRAEGRRILGTLPRLGRGEGWVWAPGNGVLAKVAFPCIRTLDSSQAPQQEQADGVPRPLAVPDVSALQAALGGAAAGAERGSRRAKVQDLERRLQRRESELAAALTRIARLEAAVQATTGEVDKG